VTEKRGLFKLNLVSLIFTMLAILFVLIAIGGMVVVAFSFFLVRGKLRQLQDLRLARRHHRIHVLDLAVDHRCVDRRRVQRRNRASDSSRHDDRPAEVMGERGATMADTVGANRTDRGEFARARSHR